MNKADLESYLRHQIPLVNSLGAVVSHADENYVEVRAPLELNKNHLGTIFGGSIYSISVLSCYGWLFNSLDIKNIKCHVVIKSGQIDYLSPVRNEFSSVCQAPSSEIYDRFLQILDRKKKAQITLISEIKSGSDIVCRFQGEFVVFIQTNDTSKN